MPFCSTPRYSLSSHALLIALTLSGAGAARAAADPARPATPPAAKEVSPNPIRLATLPESHGVREAERRRGEDPAFLRFVRQLDAESFDENPELRARAAWLWYRLTYPTGRLPSDPWGRAAEHIRRFVRDAEPWPLEGAPLLAPDQMAPDAVIEPGLNTWVEFGPRPLDSTGTTNNAYQYGIVAGRLNTIVSDPTNRGAGAGDRAWIGFASGGLWRLDGIRSVNCGVSPCDVSGVTTASMWDTLIDATQGVSAIALDPSDPTGDTLYVGTGDWQAGDQFSSGMWKTTDGGATWTPIGADVFVPYSNTVPPDAAHGGCGTCTGNRWSNQNVKEIKVDPNDPDTLLVGTRYDLYISHDAGTTWQICPFGNNYTNPEGTIGSTTGINRVSGIYLDARTSTTRAYVAVGYPAQANSHENGVYGFDVPANGCPTWPGSFTPYFDGLPASTGTGTSLTGRIELDGHVDADGFLTLYAQVQNSSTYEVQGTYVMRPDNPAWPKTAGNAAIPDWRLLTGSAATDYRTCTNAASSTAQDWYDLFIRAHPTTDRLVYIGHIDAFKTEIDTSYSALGLSTAANLTNVYGTTCASYGKVHPDQHGFAFVAMPGDPNYGNWFLLADDGGIYINTSAGATGTWASLAKPGIGTNQFYAGQIGMDFGDYDGNGTRGNPNDGKQWLFGGMQDNGNASWDSTRPDLQWTARGTGGDGFWTAFDSLGGTLSSGYWIAEYTNGDLSCSSSGADGPFGTSTCGPSFAGESPDWSTPFVMDQFHCTNTQCRNVVVGGDSVWASTAYGTPSWTRLNTTVMPATASGGSIVSIAIAPSEPKAVLAGTDDGRWWWTQNAFTGAGCIHANRDTASFSCTANGSTTWQRIDSAAAVLPNRVIGGVAFDPTDHAIVYAAVHGFSEATPTRPGHIFRAVWNGSSFTIQNKSGNLPDVPAQSVAVNPYNPNQVFLGTLYGFYYTDDITAASPVWVRYMEGLPNAPIFHLTIDRGPFGNSTASTTLAAFTYGRGVFAIKLPGAGESFCSNRPAAPLPLAASTPFGNAIQLDWPDSTAATTASYRIYRATSPSGPFTFLTSLADSSPGVGGSGSYAYTDSPVSGGTTYYYQVRSLAGTCESNDAVTTSATATGDCLLAPSFAGAQSVTSLGGGQGCGLRIAWSAATTQCGGSPTYTLFRSTTPGFTPAPANLIATCLAGTSYDDSTMPLDTSVYYVVRAEDAGSAGSGLCNGGNVEENVAQVTGTASSTGGGGTLYSHDFESATGAPFYDWVDVAFVGTANSWVGRQNCTGNVFRFGGSATCTTDYANNNFRGRKPGGSAGIAVPAGSSNVTLAFEHRWQFESSGSNYYDGATVAVSLDGANYTIVPSSAITSGPAYTGGLAATCAPSGAAGIPVWSGTQSAMQATSIDLDAVCDAITSGSGGCAGQSVHVAWIGISDCSTGGDGWFIDNVAITSDPIPACTAAPYPVTFLTATGTDQQVTLEWIDPSINPFASTRLIASTSAYPADPSAPGVLTNQAGSSGQKETYFHAATGQNGVPQYYAAFANSGAGVFSERRTIAGLPQGTAGNWKWNFSTPAATLAPPIQGRGIGIFAPSNDRVFYALAKGATGGLWKSSYLPAVMNGPAQSSPIILLAAETGLPHDAALLGSQDGHVYCFNAASGSSCAGWPAGGANVDDFGLVQAQPMFDPVTHRILVGARDAAGNPGFHAVDVSNGATAWSFNNTGAQGGNDQDVGIVNGPALILGSRVVFTSRVRAGESAHTVWAIDFTASTATLAWTRDLGDIDSPPTHDWVANHVLVGTVGGSVYALDPATGGTVWSRNDFADGAIRGFISYDGANARLAFATTTKVWSIPADGTLTSWSVGSLLSPTRPLLHFGTSRWYVGACADAPCANGRLIELDAATSWSSPKTYDLTGVGGLSPVTIDRTSSPALLHAGTRTGKVVAVEIPLP